MQGNKIHFHYENSLESTKPPAAKARHKAPEPGIYYSFYTIILNFASAP